MPFMAMVSSVGKNDPAEMYNYLGGAANDKRSENMDAAFKQEKSNFRIVIVVDMWITGFDVPSLTYMYNDKPLKKHMLIQTISRVNRKYPGKEYGMIIDYIGIRDNMREAMKIYGLKQEDISIVMQNIGAMRPIDNALQYFTTNVLIGAIISVPVAFLMRREPQNRKFYHNRKQ
jgi:superfamily II DNA or RNA helicase